MIRELILLVITTVNLVVTSFYDPSDYNYNGHYGLQGNIDPYISNPGYLSEPYPESQYYPYQHFPPAHRPTSYNPNQGNQEIKRINKQGDGKKRKKLLKVSKKFKEKAKVGPSEMQEKYLITIYERPKFIVDPVKLTKQAEKNNKFTIKKKKKKIPIECKKFYKKLIG